MCNTPPCASLPMTKRPGLKGETAKGLGHNLANSPPGIAGPHNVDLLTTLTIFCTAFVYHPTHADCR